MDSIIASKRYRELARAVENGTVLTEEEQLELFDLDDKDKTLLKKYVAPGFYVICPKVIDKLLELPDRRTWMEILIENKCSSQNMLNALFSDPLYFSELKAYIKEDKFMNDGHAILMLKHPRADELLAVWLKRAIRRGFSDEVLDYILSFEDQKKAERTILKIGYENFAYPTDLRLFDLPYATKLIEKQCMVNTPASGDFQLRLVKMKDAERLVELWLSKGNYPMAEAQREMLKFSNCIELFRQMIDHKQGIAHAVQDVLFTDPKNENLLRRYVRYRSSTGLSPKAQEYLLALENAEEEIILATDNELLDENNQIAVLNRDYAVKIMSNLHRLNWHHAYPVICRDPELLKSYFSRGFEIDWRLGQKELLSLPNAAQNLEIFLQSGQELLIEEDFLFRPDGKELLALLIKHNRKINQYVREYAKEKDWL